jgi:hypothetical protein
MILREHHRNIFEREYMEKKEKAITSLTDDAESMVGSRDLLDKKTFKDIFSFDNLKQNLNFDFERY